MDSWRRCTQSINRYGWLEGRVEGAWLAQVPGKSFDYSYIQQDDIPAVMTYPMSNNEAVEINWYKAGLKFSILQCTAIKRSQNGHVLTCTDANGQLKSFMVGYFISGYAPRLEKEYGPTVGLVKRGGKTYRWLSYDKQAINVSRKNVSSSIFVIQNSKLFKNQLSYLSWNRKTRKERIQNLLNKPVDSSSLNIAAKRLSRFLASIAPEKPDYGTQKDWNTPYIRAIIDSYLKSVNNKGINRGLFEFVADIIVSLNTPQSVIFRKRIRSEYYIPEMFLYLSNADKIPEIFDNPMISIKDQESISAFIESRINVLITKMGSELYHIQNPIERRYDTSIRSMDAPNISAKFVDRIARCENPEDIKNTPEEDVVFYKDIIPDKRDKYYCFSARRLVERFDIGDTINPVTHRPFSDNFVERINSIYRTDLSDKGFLQKHFCGLVWVRFRKRTNEAE